MEIETSITSAKSEATMMLILPLVLVILMSTMGSGFLTRFSPRPSAGLRPRWA